MEEVRKIIHIDMDAFYASVEQRENSDYRGKPVAVGGSSDRGVVAAASYEARKYGVRSAMPSRLAKQKCPELIFVKPQFELYKKVSKQIMDIFHDYTDLIEPLSIDEAFLDVTHNRRGLPSATMIAREIKQRIKEETKLTASAGISINKFLAKIASDYKKPDGLFVIKPEEAESFIEKLSVEQFFGVGKVTAKKMHKLGIHTGKDLKKQSMDSLVRWFGKAGHFYYNISRAIDKRMVNPERERKSVGAENTFDIDITGQFAMITELYRIAKVLIGRIERNSFYGKTLTLKVKFSDFQTLTRSKTFSEEIKEFDILLKETKKIFRAANIANERVRLLGLYVSNNVHKPEKREDVQLTFDF